jgi:hypothetical protein
MWKRLATFSFSLVALAALTWFGSSVLAADGALVDGHKGKLTCAACHGETRKPVAVTMDKCLTCHESYDKLGKKTARLEPNPHYNHAIDIDCGRCHHSHKANEVYCQTCHQGLTFTPAKHGKD